uniref:TAFII55 protein conserved region domain-containing protein n=1 Tax=Plectus sambesii TaxID=2011161 RepID=A0A914ULS9_9BILA
EVATKVHDMLAKDSNTKDDLAISFAQDLRSVSIKFRKQILPAKIYDLPCAAETMKTLDRKNLYKVADISQIIVCTTEEEKMEAEEKRQTDDETLAKLKREKMNQWPHGLTPPMKSARKRRFRKTKKKKYMDAPEVEKELKRLLRADLEASSVRWEVFTPEQERMQKSQSSAAKKSGKEKSTSKPTSDPKERVAKSFEASPAPVPSPSVSLLPPPEMLPSSAEPTPIAVAIHEREVFGSQVSSSSSSSDDDDDDDAEEMARKLLDSSHLSGATDELTDDLASSVPSESAERIALRAELAELGRRRMDLEAEIKQLDNAVLRERLKADVAQLTELEMQKRREVI